MCGIIGYKGPENASEIIFTGLKRLEYRGYDSWGIAAKKDRGLFSLKRAEKLGEFEGKLPETHTAIGHSRWATHGGVSERNAHPHLSCDGNIAVVHNGIIENYQELRKYLMSKGHLFSSDTDTEVIAHLIEDYAKAHPFRESVLKAIEHLRGSYAIVAIKADEDEVIGARKDSPLVVGIGDGECFLASDVPAFIDHTKKVVFLGDEEMAVLNNGAEFYDVVTGKEIEKEATEVEWDAEQASKGEFEHYMIKEISEQKDSLLRAVAHEDKTLMDIADQINNAFGVFFVACGSSYHAALTASYIFSKITKKHINVVYASEFPYYEDFLTERTLMIPISQSGETADVMAAVKTAKKKGTKILSIVNVMGSSLMRASHSCLLMNSGPEIGVLSTKTYTSQVALLTMLAYACVGKLKEGKELVRKAAEAAEELTSAESRIKIVELASKLHKEEHMFSIGRGVSYPTALEAALKVKEVAYVNCLGFCGGEAKHGSIALVYDGMPCLVFSPSDETKADILSNAMELKARGAYIIGVSPENNETFDCHIKVPDVGDGNAIVDIIPVQLFSYYLAKLRGCDPDKPKHLAKAVTVR
ncbi:MAG: glutamine--fructose-6-phosphate transaminase (isomerizing) [Candidatus Diapherotrites archaeon]|nr:glutamine--fructose-6-phosphate transaminase (isomerizing) [Candidatus Diapherotrites archaeon]